jgi:hypothetical protein
MMNTHTAMKARSLPAIRTWLVFAFAATGMFLAWRSFANRNLFFGYVADDATEESPDYSSQPADDADPPLTAETFRENVPAFDISSSEEFSDSGLPAELVLPPQRCSGSGPLRFEGKITHSNPDFPGGAVRVIISYRGDDGEWHERWSNHGGTSLVDGQHLYRISFDGPSDPGTYRVVFTVSHVRVNVEDLESLPREKRVVMGLPIAEGLVEFRD